MANEQDAKRKLQLLATRIKRGQALTLTEDIRIDTALGSRRITGREDVKRVLEEGLQKSAGEVQTSLNSHDDSDRLIDEIVQELKK